MYIILHDNFDEGFLRPLRNNVLTRYGTIFFDRKRAEEIAEEVASWGLYDNIRVYELKEVSSIILDDNWGYHIKES